MIQPGLAAQQCTGAARPRPPDAHRDIVESVGATNARGGRRHTAMPFGSRSFPSRGCKVQERRNSKSGRHDNRSMSEHDRRVGDPEQQHDGQVGDSRGPVVRDAPLLRGDRGGKGDLRGSGIDDALTQNVIGAFIEVHRHLGPGLLESAYEQCLCRELSLRGLAFQRQVSVPVLDKGVHLDCGYRADLVVEARLLIELKTVEGLLPIHAAQVSTYLRLLELEVGLLINENAMSVRQGLRRIQRGRSSGAFPSLNSSPHDLPVKEGSASHDRPPSER